MVRRFAWVFLVHSCLGVWTPQMPDEGKGWHEKIAAELERSIRMYEAPASADDAEALVGKLLSDPFRMALVLGNRLIIDKRLLMNKKGMHHIEFVKSVMERGDLPNFAYQWEWNADGLNSEDQLVRGSLLATSSTSAIHGAPKNQAYASTKGGVLAMVRGLAVEYARTHARTHLFGPLIPTDTDYSAHGL